MRQKKTSRKNHLLKAQIQIGISNLQLLFVVLLCLLIVAVFLINIIAAQLGQRVDLTADLTANAAFKIGDETKALLHDLDTDVDIYVLATEDAFGGNSYFLQAQRIIEEYPQNSSRVSLTYVDYVFDPTFAARYPDLDLSQGNVLVVSGDRVKQLELTDLFNYTYTDAGSLNIESSRAEEAVTSAVLNVISGEQTSVAILKGNGMADLPDFSNLLIDNNYELTEVNLTTDTLDNSYDLVLLLGPRIDLSEDALNKLDTFLYNDGTYGKTLFYSADIAQDTLPNLETFFKEWGLVIEGGAVFETVSERTYQYQPYYPVTEYVDQTYRDMLIDASAPVLMPLAKPLDLVFTTRDNYTNEILLQFTETSGVRPPEAVEGFTIEQATRWGPIPALILASRRIYGTTGMTQYRSNIVLSASTAMLDAFSIQNTSLSNSEYLLDLFNNLTERTDMVNIQPKSLAGKTLSITTAQVSRLGMMLAGIIPFAILAAGITIWLVRRYK